MHKAVSLQTGDFILFLIVKYILAILFRLFGFIAPNTFDDLAFQFFRFSAYLV